MGRGASTSLEVRERRLLSRAAELTRTGIEVKKQFKGSKIIEGINRL